MARVRPPRQAVGPTRRRWSVHGSFGGCGDLASSVTAVGPEWAGKGEGSSAAARRKPGHPVDGISPDRVRQKMSARRVCRLDDGQPSHHLGNRADPGQRHRVEFRLDQDLVSPIASTTSSGHKQALSNCTILLKAFGSPTLEQVVNRTPGILANPLLTAPHLVTAFPSDVRVLPLSAAVCVLVFVSAQLCTEQGSLSLLVGKPLNGHRRLYN
ncbi:unnamed protein product [Protopolystoma xenopodis]|uniref:Uncharacterized protein n=1 Tax=Protopolystoma xenopodis TaxID=117903 RepID=A0A448XS51_9PLAT|nr:unnamed protein product [Protopolystoma xenopodis]